MRFRMWCRVVCIIFFIIGGVMAMYFNVIILGIGLLASSLLFYQKVARRPPYS